jgi:hypothetical protein
VDKLPKAARAVVIVFLALLVLPVSVDAAGLGIAPAAIEIGDALKGESYWETLFVKYSGQGESTVRLGAEGDIGEWVTFYPMTEPETPIDAATAVAGEWTRIVAEFKIPGYAQIGPSEGVLRIMTVPGEGGSGGSVSIQARATVSIDVVAQFEIVEATGTFEIPQQLFDFTDLDADVGKCAVRIDVDIYDAPEGAAIVIGACKEVPAELNPGLELAASDAGVAIDDLAYVVRVEKVNLTAEKAGPATVTLKVGRAWAERHGPENINIFRLSNESGVLLPTTFIGYEGEFAVFEAVSEGGLAYFALAAVSPLPSSMNWTLIGAAIGGMIPVAAAAGIVVRRRRQVWSS